MRMGRIVCIIIYITVSFLVSSCIDHDRVRRTLYCADRLMDDSPDSALVLLMRDSALFVRAGEDEKMEYELLKHEAEDKCYMTSTSDSAMLRVVEYYAFNGSPLQKVRSNYVLGRIYYEMRHFGSSLSSFADALKVEEDKDPIVCRYKALTCTWIASVYEEEKLYEKALSYSKLFYTYAKMSDAPTNIIYSLRDIGRDYSLLKQNSIAIGFYLRAADKAKNLKDTYLLNLVNGELAVLYIEENMFDKARAALSSPCISHLNINIASSYFTWAVYYEAIGEIDSAIICNKKGMKYATTDVKKSISLSLAHLYENKRLYQEAQKYRELYARYDDSLSIEKVDENRDFISHVKKNIDNEQKKAQLEVSKKNLFIWFVLSSIVASIIVLYLFRLNKRRENQFKSQQKRIDTFWNKWKGVALSSIREKTELIKSLEINLSSSVEENTDLNRKLMRSEAEKQKMKEWKILYEQKHSELIAADFSDTGIYKLFHDPIALPSKSDFHRLAEALNEYYDGFTLRLKELYPGINNNDIWICCMVKTGLTSKEICNISHYAYNTLSMMKSRLYEKLTQKKGRAKDFDNFINGF